MRWDKDGPPVSRLYGDVYFSRTDGLDESRRVFLAGCGLPRRWRGRARFCVGELGFGAGRNIAALLQLWGRTQPRGSRLSIFSIEAHPMAAGDAARALAPWSELAEASALLVARWPGVARGFHRIDLPEFAATLDVAIMPAIDALAAWTGRADAWFLDGFSPRLNPEMWRADVLRRVAQRSAPGAYAATYTAARSVRRDLAEAGFTVERLGGAGAKRHRLAARLPGRPKRRARRPSVVVIGAGISGASLVRALAGLDVQAGVVDAIGPGAGASGPPAALVAPRLDAGLAAPAELFIQACRRAAGLYSATPGAILGSGLVQLETGDKDARRFTALATSDLFEPGEMTLLDVAETRARFGEPAPPGLLVAGARVINPAAVLSAWAPDVKIASVALLERHGARWRGTSTDGAVLFEADIVCLAAGMSCARLAGDLPLVPVRGQASLAAGVTVGSTAAFGGYVVSLPDGVMFGATHDRGDEDPSPRPADEARNLTLVAAYLPGLAKRLEAAPRTCWAAVRATTRDYLPIAGELAPGLFVLAGLGSRGFTIAPLLAEHIAATALEAPSPLPAKAAALISPDRFAQREARRGRSQSPRV